MPDHIPAELAETFNEAVFHYEIWHPTNEGRQFRFSGEYLSIYAIFGLASQFTDVLQPAVLDKILISYVHDQLGGEWKAELNKNPTYATAAIVSAT